MNVHFRTLGCRLNEAETESWAEKFRKNGHFISQDAEAADLIVLNSCAVTQQAVRKSRGLIKRLKRENSRAKLVVSGCYATLDKAQATAISGVDLVVSNSDKDKLYEFVKEELALETIPSFTTKPGQAALFSRGRQRAFIKVQDGCRHRCTYCIVTTARGQEKSRPISEIVNEVNALEQCGIKEIVLTGVHLGGYGSDFGVRLENLLRAILDDTSISRIRLGSLEPWDLRDALFDLFLDSRMMPHLHLPLQSGSNSVLKRMSRRCTTSEYTNIVQRIRAISPEFNVTTDIIVGFPGETKEEWANSFDYISNINFGDLHIFSYSLREGTAAARMPRQISDFVKKQRSKSLHELCENMKKNTYSRFLGNTVPVLWEKTSDSKPLHAEKLFGYTPNYLRVVTTSDYPNKLENQIVPVRLQSIEKSGVYINAVLL